MKKKVKRYFRLFRLITYVLIVLIFFIFLKIFFNTSSATYEVYLETEKVEFRSNKAIDSKWGLDSAIVKENYGDTTFNFSGTIQLPPYSKISINRKSFGTIYVSIEDTKESNPVVFYDDNFDPIHSTYSLVEIYVQNMPDRVKSGNTIIWPLNGIQGQISTGKPIGRENESSIPILREGIISIYHEGLFSSGVYKAGSFELKMGDELTINEPENSASGLVGINEKPNINLVYRIVGKGAEIRKLDIPRKVYHHSALKFTSKFLA